MTFLEEMHLIFDGVFDLLEYQLTFPDPIGNLSMLQLWMFFAVAYMVADSVSMIASRRD